MASVSMALPAKGNRVIIAIMMILTEGEDDPP